jgi:hypothetical protein
LFHEKGRPEGPAGITDKNTSWAFTFAIENHAEDFRLSMLEKFAASVGKKLEVKLT